MKTQKNKAGLYHYKTNDRWKWMAGATAATAAGVTASQASTITVTLSGNFLSSSLGNHLSDAIPASAGGGTMNVSFKSVLNYVKGSTAAAAVTINNVFNQAIVSVHSGVTFFRATFGSQRHSNFGPSITLSGTIPITFTDPSINGGATTNGMLMVTDTAGPGFNAEVQLDSFTYKSTAALPDSGSTLALLAMGAGGVIALRQRRKAA